MEVVASIRTPLITGGKSVADVSDDICRQVEGAPSRSWMLAIAVSSSFLIVGAYAVSVLLWEGIGVWGLNKTVGWAWDITNFVWWVGIGHAGTLISAILLLFRQKWRMGINRAAEAMTIFAVICAAMFPMFHMGRLWVGFYWALPLPNTFGSLWVNFNSPLLWDVFAISTYFAVSLVFWYIGLIPDFATIRDRAKNQISKNIYGVLSFGWMGGAKNWARYESVSLILAGIATPLVLSVHTIVSMDFATSVIPGWHTTIFPPYFVSGARFSGFAMVLTLLIITRRVFHLEAYWWAYWTMMTCNVLSPQLFWIKKIRTNIAATFIMSIVINIGMWFERFVIIVTSLHRDYIPSSWAMFYPTRYDVGVYMFSFGFFFTAFLLFAKFFPVVNMAEVKSIIKGYSEK